MSAILLKYPTFGMCFHGQNKYKIEFSAHFSVCTKKLIYKYSEKHLQSIVDEKETLPCLLFLIQIFGCSLLSRDQTTENVAQELTFENFFT